MPNPAADPVLVTFVGGTMLLSMATGLYLIYAQFHGPILRYAPRRLVPWGAFATAIAVLYLVTGLITALPQPHPEQTKDKDKATAASSKELDDKDKKIEKIDSGELAGQMLGAVAPMILIVVGFVFIIAVMSHATPRDLGLPSSWYELAIDARTGFAAALAALLPVHLIQGLLMTVMNIEESEHPLVRMVREGEPSVAVMVIAGLSAVVVAPICEELAFRLMLQGWLEKWEDRKLGWRTPSLPVASVSEETSAPEIVQLELANDATRPLVVDAVDGITSSLVTEPPSVPPPPSDPPERGLAGLPYGWLPIIVSSAMFGVAHLGYGPEPVPLFFLALFLGYMYQRTHRIVPSIVCHACFNAFTVFVLWRMVFHGAH